MIIIITIIILRNIRIGHLFSHFADDIVSLNMDW